MTAPSRKPGRAARARLTLLACTGLLGACAQGGDFGRPKAGAWNDVVAATGTVAARERGGPASAFALTDDEGVLRERAWRFLMPAAPDAAFRDALANLTRTRVLPPSWRPDDPAAYHAGLIGEGFRSGTSRYRRLSDDAVADARLIPAFADVAGRVNAADAVRLRGLPLMRSLDDWDLRQAAARVAENRCLIAWVRLETASRAERYRYALEHLVAEVPGPEAVGAERAIRGLEARRTLLDPLLPPDAAARCGLGPEAPPAQAAEVAAPATVIAKD